MEKIFLKKFYFCAVLLFCVNSISLKAESLGTNLLEHGKNAGWGLGILLTGAVSGVVAYGLLKSGFTKKRFFDQQAEIRPGLQPLYMLAGAGGLAGIVFGGCHLYSHQSWHVPSKWAIGMGTLPLAVSCAFGIRQYFSKEKR